MNVSSTSIQLEIAAFRSQALSSLMSLSADGNDAADFAGLLDIKSAELDASGRNTALNDPESAYKMMTRINCFEVSFKAQFSELTQMGSSVEHMEAVGRQLGDIDLDTANTEIVAMLQRFVDQYNAWEDRFDDTIERGGVLHNIQAAEVSIRELELSVRNIFNGAADGVRGLGGLGIDIDPVSKQATLDIARLEALLASNKRGAVRAIDEFSANFAKSADLLNSAGNFIPTQLDNRSRAIQFIADNRSSLRAEFGTGDAARPTGAVATALAAYESMTAL